MYSIVSASRPGGSARAGALLPVFPVAGSVAAGFTASGNEGADAHAGSDIQTETPCSCEYSICYLYLTKWLNENRGEFTLSLTRVLVEVLLELLLAV